MTGNFKGGGMNYTVGNFGKLFNFITSFQNFGENRIANSAVLQQSTRVC